MLIRIKRAYDPPEPQDGARFLVDRLWPRGVKRAALNLDGWLKDAAQSPDSPDGRTVTLLYSAQETQHNNAVALKAYLERRS